MSYTGKYYGENFINHAYEPVKDITLSLVYRFPFKYEEGLTVRCRKPRKKSLIGEITDKAYSSQGQFGGKYGGGTVKVYKINGKWYYEGEIKEVVE